MVMLLTSCTPQKPFNKAEWEEKGDLDIYPNRKAMLNDLITHYKLKGLSYKQLIDLLGKPEDYIDTEPNTLYYNIIIDYGMDIDPVYIKHLVFILSTDSTVKGFEIKEIKH